MKKPVAIGLILAGIAAAGCFVWATLPKIRSEYVGKWQQPGPVEHAQSYEFFPDGTYRWRSDHESWRYDPRIRMRARGTWRASRDRLYLTATELTADGIVSHRQAFAKMQRDTLHRTRAIPIRWNSATRWYVADIAMPGFRKVP